MRWQQDCAAITLPIWPSDRLQPLQQLQQTHALSTAIMSFATSNTAPSGSPFGQPQRSGFTSAPVKKLPTPEPVELLANRNQIIEALVPFQKPASPVIRAVMHNEILTPENQKCLLYRNTNGWTSVALDSTADMPKVTADPKYLLKVAWRAFTNCQAVSTVTMRLKDGTIFTYDDIDRLVFDPLTADAPNVVPTAFMTSAMPSNSAVPSMLPPPNSMLPTTASSMQAPMPVGESEMTEGNGNEYMEAMLHDIIAKLTVLDQKVAFVVDAVTTKIKIEAPIGGASSNTVNKPTDNDGDVAITTPETTKAVGKRRMVSK